MTNKALSGILIKMDKFVAKRPKLSNFVNALEEDRKKTAESITTFKFNKRRVKILTDLDKVRDKSNGIVYWMFRDSRVQDNWAFLFAQKIAIKNAVPLHICFSVLPKFLDATIRHFKFLLKGLEQVEAECNNLNINFHLLLGEPNVEILKFVTKYNMGAVITDFFPLRVHLSWVEDLKKKLPKDVPICQVDAHNIVPCWEASDKLEYSARTIRNKINSKLSEYLTPFPPVIKHPHITKLKFVDNDWKNVWKHIKVDETVKEITWAQPGYEGGILELESFIEKRLKIYESKRNDPLGNALSNLSPWFHFGMISVQRCILEVSKYKKTHTKSVESFMEEAIVRRELSDNFCFYNEHYDSLKGAKQWALDTLDKHREDKREYLYTLKEFEKSMTHDDLWNSAQIQLVQEGKMHGFLRMYWAKKILEWTSTPEQALEWSIYLNDKYSMDGRDPSGYVGCMWSICGIHDQGWAERSIFGKIRYMNYKGCQRKFDVKAFVARWGGKVHNKKK
ncbi:deoxyribodipyrimidine photo-lyase isoform X2 [Athalia rosae]|uniref:deoxyribodipyrimidine photo-lyase isoform X2 n=1 Tax=Athalia rosae TaxID=37344 RepID=UPI002034A098|nr:deoxyribodipyrimidine photo-lyase isoform X2 [Athalia rosae]XP_020707616.2 deoxyribodipyrimidine photo-lyase isoform X2 [Athalia rosae]XP_048508940.1 deoxyribodipyrimidine photo-lyase isoform X2 [Athalia rosae]XP_048508947.1 deoxyribodipyrimidine photo-lyase isoform X2 [Athalia rosae]